jgi:hypothetical protein
MTRQTQFLKRKALLLSSAAGVTAMLAATALIGLPASSDAASASARANAAPAPVAPSHGGVGAKHNRHGRGHARSATASDATSGGRPQISLYMEGAEVGAIWQNYEACLAEGGFQGYLGGELSAEQEAEIAAAEPGCVGAKPIPAPSQDPATNPHFARDRAAEVACDNAAGLPVEEIPGGWTYGEATTARGRFLLSLEGEGARDKIQRSCELKAFSPDEPLPAS